MNGTRMWGQHPIRIIERWHSVPDHRKEVGFKQIEIIRNFAAVRKFLSANGIAHICTNEYAVSKDNVHIWARCLLQCLELLERNLPFVKDRRGTRTVGVPQPPLSRGDIYDAMTVLDALLHAKLLESLITNALDTHIADEYGKKMQSHDE